MREPNTPVRRGRERERKRRTAVQRVNRPRLEHLSGGGSCRAHLLRVSSKENSSCHPKAAKQIWEGSDLAAQADRKLNQSLYDHWSSHLSGIVRSRHTSNAHLRSLGRRDLTGLVGLERLLDVWTGSSANWLLVKKWSFLWVAGFQGSQLHPTPHLQQWAQRGPLLGVTACVVLSESGGKD